MSSPVSRVSDALASASGDLLGSLVWGDLELAAAKLARSEIRTAFLNHGLPVALQPEQVTGQHALGRAVGKSSVIETHRFVREEPRSRVVLQLRPEGEKLSRADQAVARITVNSKGGLDYERGSRWDIAKDAAAFAMLEAWHHDVLQYVDAAEFQGTITKALMSWMQGTRMRRHGSVYFIPPSRRSDLASFAAAVESFKGCTMPVLDVHDSSANRSTASRALATSLDADVREAIRECKELAEKSARTSTWEARAEQVAAMRTKVDMLARVLDSRADTLRGHLAKLDANIREMLAGAGGPELFDLND